MCPMQIFKVKCFYSDLYGICFSIEMTYLLLATLNNILYQSQYLICLVNGFQGNNPRLNTIRLAKMGEQYINLYYSILHFKNRQ
jgi:hypothetical protein